MFTDKIYALSPVTKALIWGGKKLTDSYNKICSDDTYGKGVIGESWELVSYRGDVCSIIDGIANEIPINEAVTDEIPIILKYIDAAEPLSVQVHPNKTEMWYVLDAEEGAEIVYGLKEQFCEKNFRDALENGSVFDLLKTVKVKPGDVFFIPSGLVHSLGKGILVAEIQQASTDTYRVYDFNRLHNGKPRDLHVDAAMNVISDYTDEELFRLRYSCGKSETDNEKIADCKYFAVYKYDGKTRSYRTNAKNAAVMCVSGNGTVGGKAAKKGETFFVSASCEDFTLDGTMEALVCFFDTKII